MLSLRLRSLLITPLVIAALMSVSVISSPVLAQDEQA